MKRILFLLLLTVSVYGQNPSRFAKIQITSNSNSGTATKVNVQEANGEVNTQTINTAFNKNFGLNAGDVVGATTLLNQYSTTPVDWSATTFTSGQSVFYGGKQYVAVSNTVALDVPSVSAKWVETTFENIYDKTVPLIANSKPSTIDLVALGDSVTFGAGSTTGSTSYIDIINAKLGFKSFTKLAVSGTRTMPGGGMPDLFTQVQAIPAGSDLITVMIGINDRSVSPLGNLNTVLNKAFASLDRTLSFAEAFRFNLETIKRNFPLAKIFVLTPTKTTWSSSPSLDAYAQIEIGIANFLGIPVIDTNTSSGIYYNSPYLADATHPNDTGYSIIADFVEASLKSASQQRYVDTGIGTTNNIAKWTADGRLVDSGIIENATGVRLLNVINATSGLGIGMLVNSTINASANNDVLSTFRAVGTFNPGAFTGVNGYAIRSSGALRVDRFSDSSQQLVIDNVNAGTTLTSYSNPAGAKEMILNSTTNTSNTPVGSGLNGILFQVRGDTKGQLFNDGRWMFQNGGTFTNNGVDSVQITGSAIATAWKTSGGTTAQYVTGTGSLVNFDSGVRTAVLTGYTSGAGTITAADNVLQAIQKLNGNVNAAARPYKVYTATISQTGTSAPTITVLENTLGVTVTPSRSAIGSYVLTFSGTVTGNAYAEIHAFGVSSGQTPPTRYGISGGNTNITISSSLFNGGLLVFENTDSLLSGASIEVRYY